MLIIAQIRKEDIKDFKMKINIKMTIIVINIEMQKNVDAYCGN